MKIVGFESGNATHLGVVEGDQVIDLQAADASAPADLGEWLRRSNGDLSALRDLAKKAPAAARRPLAGLKYTMPVTKPGKIICLGLNYLDHVKEGPQKDNIPKFQSIFFRMASSLTANGQPLLRPKKSMQFDYEGELVVVIGKAGRNVPKERAHEYVFGVTAGNDVGARDWQKNDVQWWRAKGCDNFAPCGPYVATGLDYGNLDLQVRVNGKVKMKTNTKMMVHDVAAVVSYLSRHITLRPGDLIYTGTAGKTEPIRVGDVVEIELSGVGVLRNRVAAAPKE